MSRRRAADVGLPTGFWKRLGQAARLACGVPDYEAYLRHQRQRHPEQRPMTPAEFFDDRQKARYRRGTSRCC
jgi:uncharacterized short protein YbdD (DUF466 family)